ncbi:MAG: AEC family transporter, partial [Clostridia bacterium]|nr:AEC family transporter [Clostridia bacterium]
MDSLLLSVEAVTPIFLLMLLGYGLKQFKMATKDQFNAINRLIFKVFLPLHLFYSVYKTDIKTFFDGKLILFAVITVLIVFAVGYGLVFLFTKENAKRGVMLQGFFRSNFAILGIPLVNYICGEAAGGLSALIVAIIIPLYNILAVITLERFRDGKIQFGKLLKGIATNPLVVSCLIGVIFLALGIQLPSLVETTVNDA